jgi:formate dehydrogenase maturation protein FdhE
VTEVDNKLVLRMLIGSAVILIILGILGVIEIGLFLILLTILSIVYYLYYLNGKKEIKQPVINEEELKICPICGAKNLKNRKYCRKCNNDIQNITCPVCGTKNDFKNKYCSECDSISQVIKRH